MAQSTLTYTRDFRISRQQQIFYLFSNLKLLQDLMYNTTQQSDQSMEEQNVFQQNHDCYFACGFAPQEGFYLTVDGEDSIPLSFHHYPLLNSEEIGFDAFAMLYEPEENQPQASHQARNSSIPEGQIRPIQQDIARPMKKGKNSNAVKKMGRMILSRLEEYDYHVGKNTGVTNMLTSIGKQEGQKKVKKKTNVHAQSDRFNTSHLKALFDVDDNRLCAFNLRTTRHIFSRELRREVLESRQLKGDSKLVYLIALKCSSLRFMNKRLAYRLQASPVMRREAPK